MQPNAGQDPNADQIAYWNAAAGQTWVEFQDRLDRQIDPLGLRAMRAAAPEPGERCLDIGCGCGQSSLELADRIGRTGRVVGLDISRPMLEVARGRAAKAGLSGVQFVEADAQTYAFEPAAFDLLYSRFGVMFFADPAAAFANLGTALRPGGRLAFVCWRPLAENPWMGVPLKAAMSRLAPPPPPDPLAPGPFAFADPERIASVLAAAGFETPTITPHDEKIGAGDLDQSVATALRVGPLGALLREQPDRRDEVIGLLRDSLAPHLTPDGVKMDSATWIVRAEKA